MSHDIADLSLSRAFVCAALFGLFSFDPGFFVCSEASAVSVGRSASGLRDREARGAPGGRGGEADAEGGEAEVGRGRRRPGEASASPLRTITKLRLAHRCCVSAEARLGIREARLRDGVRRELRTVTPRQRDGHRK